MSHKLQIETELIASSRRKEINRQWLDNTRVLLIKANILIQFQNDHAESARLLKEKQLLK